VKSLGGIRISSAQVKPKGFENDRRWMLTDENNLFLTQRVQPLMSQFGLSEGDSAKAVFKVTFGSDTLDIPLRAEGNSTKAQIFDDVVEVKEVSAACSMWFSERLKIKCRLVAFPEENARPVDPKYKLGDDHVSLADGYPILIIGQGSLDDLNNRLSQPVPMNRFRPNIVFTGGEPYEEDQWKRFTIGGNKYAGVKTCGRCVITTVDQDTGIKGKEPLATLASYRNVDNRTLFGMNLIPINHGTIKEGDEIILS
jgi:uncharacterized protein YcbX